MDKNYDPRVRNGDLAADDFHIYKAKIFKVLGPQDDRLQVRILPYMMAIPKEDQENLPRYPPFIKGQVITGLSEEEDGPDKAEEVWVIAVPDFTLGFILGKANLFGKNTKANWEPDKGGGGPSYDYGSKDGIKAFLRRCRSIGDDMDYNHMIVRNWVASPQGGHIEMYNYLNGDWYLANFSGTTLCVLQKKIYIRVGSPGNPGQKVDYTSIEVTADKCFIKTPKFELDAKVTVLGRHGVNAVGCNSPLPVGVEGSSFVPITDDKMGAIYL